MLLGVRPSLAVFTAPPRGGGGAACGGLLVDESFFACLILARLGDELVALTVDVDDLDVGIVAEQLAQLGDVDVHAAGVEVVVVYPDGLQGVVTLQHLVGMGAEEGQQLALFGGELGHLLADGEGLLLGVEHELADAIEGHVFGLLALDAAQDGFDAREEHLHAEGLREVVVGAVLEALEHVLVHRLGGEEDQGHVGVDLADVLRQGKAVLLGHHHVQEADVILGFGKALQTCFAIGEEVGGKTFGLEVFAEDHTQVLVVFAEEDSQFFIHHNACTI